MSLSAKNASEARDSARRNMYLGALLRSASRQARAKIRNMSALGALIESAFIPEPNSSVELIRGRYVARGRVVWSEAQRCGIRFAAEVSVNDWLAPVDAQPALASAPLQPEQPAAEPLAPQLDHGTSADPLPSSLFDDLQEAVKIVARMARDLGTDTAFLREHMTQGRALLHVDHLLSGVCKQLAAHYPCGGEGIEKGPPVAERPSSISQSKAA